MSKIIGIPLGWVMFGIYAVFKNYGIAIMLFTLLTKVLMFPTSYKQQLGSARMQSLNPKLKQLKQQYAKNPQKLQEEQAKLYQQEGINPMASCLPMIVQMIFLYGVYYVVYAPLSHILRFSSDIITKASEIITSANLPTDKYFSSRPELTIMKYVKTKPELFSDKAFSDVDFVGKITDFKETFLGINLGAIPTIHPDDGWTAAAIGLVLVPIMSGVIQLIFTLYSQYKSKKMNPEMNMGAMNIVMFIMPLFSVWLAFNVPAGVGMYWIFSSLFSLIQSIGLYAYFTPERVAVIHEKEKEKKSKKPGLMAKMLEQQQALMEQQGMSVRKDYSKETEGMSRKEMQEYNRKLINEARKRMAEKYGDDYTEEPDDTEN